MKTERLMNAIKKNGHSVSVVLFDKRTWRYSCIGKNYNVEWYCLDKKEDISVYIQPNDDQDEIEGDYFCGHFAKTIKEVLTYLSE